MWTWNGTLLERERDSKRSRDGQRRPGKRTKREQGGKVRRGAKERTRSHCISIYKATVTFKCNDKGTRREEARAGAGRVITWNESSARGKAVVCGAGREFSLSYCKKHCKSQDGEEGRQRGRGKRKTGARHDAMYGLDALFQGRWRLFGLFLFCDAK